MSNEHEESDKQNEKENPLEAISNMYKEIVAEQDAKGFAEVYAKATPALFKAMKKDAGLDLHFEDVEYLDGYFIFGYGTNSVVHFHVKEAPGWLFGIWWSPIPTKETENEEEDKQEYRKDKIHCQVFFQFEKEIDKFKPTASTFSREFDFNLEKGEAETLALFDLQKDIAFLVKEPYLAFYREMHWIDFNHEYVSREKAKRYWDRHWKEKEKRRQLDLLNAREMYGFYQSLIKDFVETGDAFIYDRGESIDPRYEVVIRNIKLDNGEYLGEENGFYYLFDVCDDGTKEDEKLYKRKVRECAKRYRSRFYYDNPFSDGCQILDDERFDEYLKESIADGQALYYKKEDGSIFVGEVKLLFDK